MTDFTRQTGWSLVSLTQWPSFVVSLTTFFVPVGKKPSGPDR